MATLTPSVASPRAKIDVVRVDVAGLDQNEIAGYDPAEYPASPEVRAYIAFLLGGVEYGRSYVFSGSHAFNSYIFPDDGSWTMSLRREDTDAVIVDQAITVV
jgi:hypothetical protein